MEQHGNTTTFNLESVLRQNILNSQYYQKTVVTLTSWQEVVDEIFYSVKDCEPWLGGNARGASTAFCLLYRLFELCPTVQDVRNLLDHPDSPYIRAIGLLYLRYVGNPKQLWDWFLKYIRDPEEFQPSGPGQKTITIGAYARDILLDQYYFETIFPRVPKPVLDDIERRLQAGGFPTKPVGNAGQGGADRRGIEDGSKRPASVKASLSVAMGQRAPNRAGAREEGRGLGSSMQGGASPKPERGDDQRRREDERERRREDERERRREDERERRREDDRERRREDDRERRREGSRDRRRRDDDSDRRRRDDSRGRRPSSRRSRSPGEYRQPRSKDRREEHRRRSRSRERVANGRDARDVFGGGSKRQTVSAADLKSRYGDLKQVALVEEQNGGKKVTGKEEIYRIGGL